MDFETPWDGWELDPIPMPHMPPPIPRLKLSLPNSYLSILPAQEGAWLQAKWGDAKSASDMLVVVNERSKYHKIILNELAIFTPDSSPGENSDLEDQKPKINIIDLNTTILDTINAWYKLLEQAETIENNLLAIRFREDMPVSRKHLEDQLHQIQSSASEKTMELSEKAVDANNKLGMGSLQMTELLGKRDWSQWISVFYANHDEEKVKPQVEEWGVFEWWIGQMSGKIGSP